MAKQLDLPHHYRQHLETLLREHLPRVEVWAYGSRVNGQSHDGSDLDLVLRSPDLQQIPADSLASFSEALRESPIPFLVAAQDWARLPESFHPEIEREHLVLVAVDNKLLNKRDSGMGSEWQELCWGDLATLEYGRALRGHNSRTGPIRVFGTNGPIGWHDEALCSYPSVVIGRKGAYRGVHYSPEPFFVIDTAFYLKPKVELDTRWAYYQLLTQDINGLDSGSAIPSTRREDFYSLPVQVPPLSEQRAIAQILGTLDDKIELNRRLNETLEELARAIFKDWFVDFGPVRAKLEGRDTGLPEHLAELFPDRLVESELGEIPEGWRALPAGEAVTVRGGTTPSTKEPAYWGGEHCFATPKDLSLLQEPVLASTARRLTDAGVARIRSGLLPPGTLLLSSRAPIGYLAVTTTPVAINQGIIALICDGPVGAPYALNWIRSNMAAIEARASGTTFLEISKSSFREIPLLVPSESIHAAYESLVVPLYDLVAVKAQESRTLAALRDALLSKLVSGEMRTHNAPATNI